jgi:hypothetical protein
MFMRSVKLAAAAAVVSMLAACAHPISLEPAATPTRDESNLVAKKVAYVLTETDRAKEVTTAGGGGDKVSYFPYRDLEKSLRDALRSVYTEVVAVRSGSDAGASGAAYVFTPEIKTTSSSPSPFTWPPTRFETELTCSVTDPTGAAVSRVTATGSGAAEFDEFKSDFSLSARRASQDVAAKFAQSVRQDAKLR